MRSQPSSNIAISNNKPKKGTIPFYFNIQRYDKNKQTVNPSVSIGSVDKGTIPYYFPVFKKMNSDFFRA